MPRLAFSPAALDDVDRLTEFLLQQSIKESKATAPLLLSGLSTLKQHPLIGRPVEHGLRELLISRGRTGYVALYRFDAKQDVVLVLRIRHQREHGQ